ncbi:Rossmann-fold NAD(P)-binding domain-containing protein [Flavobacterium reichenbachii]|uniref:NmrA family transcriptional regulator n=1 Tax=Flavobacterium reichenbachii TaxID=362418 RepID=A0A085ZM18_9FLAO|nr:NmrA family transcriptional regulator [Flavobacterium reichenbachii]KFF05482.1 NmrA family transcriptional regulator [Flavobacterium reichenbachii]OXB17822.1 NmrA family transcriptional regulator [Flavobacterium reichenbachii]
METKKILLLGGNGKTGRRAAHLLDKINNVEVRIGSRNENPSFDWENPETWLEAIKGIDTVYITFQPDLALPGAPEIIRKFTKLASENGVGKMVLLSGRGEKEAQICEEIVKSTAKEWTIVRASWFNQNFSESIFLEPILAGRVALPQSHILEPFTDADDIAALVVEALLYEQHNGKTYELTGPRLLNFEQAVAEIAKVTGREIIFQPISIEEYVNMLREYQVPEDMIWLVNYLFSQVLDGRNSSITNDIEKVLGRKALDFTEYAKKTAHTGIWNEVNELS